MATGKKTGGGSRKGKPNKSTEEVRALVDKVAKRHGGLKTLFEKLFELTEGVTVQGTNKKGETFIYEKPPDAFAAKTILEYRFGKAPQSIDVTSLGEKLSLQIVYAK